MAAASNPRLIQHCSERRGGVCSRESISNVSVPILLTMINATYLRSGDYAVRSANCDKENT